MKLYYQTTRQETGKKRLIFQMSEMAPKASDAMQGKEAKSEAVQLGEVAPQTPSEIYNGVISAGSSFATQFRGGMASLASLANVDPLASSSGSGTTTTTATTTTTGTTTTAAVTPTTVTK